MSVNDIDIKKRAEMAATLLIRAPVLKVPQAMRAAEFTLEQSQNPTLQQRVRRIWKEKLNRQTETTPVERVVLRPNRSPVSGLTLISAAADLALPPPPRRRSLVGCCVVVCRAAATAAAAAAAPPFVGWLLRCCPPSDFVNRRSCRAAAIALPPSSCAPPPRRHSLVGCCVVVHRAAATATVIVCANQNLTFFGGVLRHMPLLLLDQYGQTKRMGHRPCMWEDIGLLCLLGAAKLALVWAGAMSTMVWSMAGALTCPCGQ